MKICEGLTGVRAALVQCLRRFYECRPIEMAAEVCYNQKVN